MDSKYCSSCIQKHALSSFLKDTSSDLGSKIFSTCIPCRAKNSKKRKALQPLCPNVPPKRRGRPKLSVLPPSHPIRPLLIPRPLASAFPPLLAGNAGPTTLPPPSESRTRPSLPPVQRQIQPQAAGFLPTEQWGYIQRFNAAMAEVKMETCLRCKERWFAMDLKGEVCHACFLRDKGSKTPSSCPPRTRWTRGTFRPAFQS